MSVGAGKPVPIFYCREDRNCSERSSLSGLFAWWAGRDRKQTPCLLPKQKGSALPHGKRRKKGSSILADGIYLTENRPLIWEIYLKIHILPQLILV